MGFQISIPALRFSEWVDLADQANLGESANRLIHGGQGDRGNLVPDPLENGLGTGVFDRPRQLLVDHAALVSNRQPGGKASLAEKFHAGFQRWHR